MTDKKTITQVLKMEKPVQFIGMLKRIQGPQEGDVVIAYPMIEGYTLELSADSKKLTLVFDLSEQDPPEDWEKNVVFQNDFEIQPMSLDGLKTKDQSRQMLVGKLFQYNFFYFQDLPHFFLLCYYLP